MFGVYSLARARLADTLAYQVRELPSAAHGGQRAAGAASGVGSLRRAGRALPVTQRQTLTQAARSTHTHTRSTSRGRGQPKSPRTMAAPAPHAPSPPCQQQRHSSPRAPQPQPHTQRTRAASTAIVLRLSITRRHPGCVNCAARDRVRRQIFQRRCLQRSVRTSRSARLAAIKLPAPLPRECWRRMCRLGCRSRRLSLLQSGRERRRTRRRLCGRRSSW